MLSLIDSIEKDLQIVEGKMSRILSEIQNLENVHKRLDRDRENLVYAINQLEGLIDG